jgi:hypothetical protein
VPHLRLPLCQVQYLRDEVLGDALRALPELLISNGLGRFTQPRNRWNKRDSIGGEVASPARLASNMERTGITLCSIRRHKDKCLGTDYAVTCIRDLCCPARYDP